MKSSIVQRVKACAVIVGLAALLAGCVIAPARPYYYHPHPYWGYYR